MIQTGKDNSITLGDGDQTSDRLREVVSATSRAWSHPSRAEVAHQLPLRELAESYGIDFVEDAIEYASVPEFVERIPIAYARQWILFGGQTDTGEKRLALSSLDHLDQLDVINRHLGWRAEPILAPAEVIHTAINAAYESRTGQTQLLLEEIDHETVLGELATLTDREDLLDSASRAPVIKLVNLLLFEAVKLEASDIHLQPYESNLTARMRMDGILFDLFTLPKSLQEEITSRIKIIGGMNIAEKRLPQDGRATVQAGNRVIDLRISSVPTSCGERIVIRLLDKSARRYCLEEIGLCPESLRRFNELIQVEHGLILVTGPTGSGKTTTLYGALQEINSSERNVITLEDPIEYLLPGVSQIQVNTKKGMTFASGLRSVLRQDPDIIMVGEIRDEETAIMAIQSALTGHLVFSTLHTNDAASAITRLLDLGIEPYLAASCLIGVMAQRLVRLVCSSCQQPHVPTEEELAWLGIDPGAADLSNVRNGVGCESCRQTGYRGRIGLFELLTVTEELRHHIMTHATAAQIKQAAISCDMSTLKEDGRDKTLRGMTTFEEVFRVTMRATV